MFELATSVALRLRSCLMVAVNWKGRQRHDISIHDLPQLCRGRHLKRTRGGKVYQAQKATMKPNQEKKNTRPYMLIGLKKGMERAFRLIGFTSGASHRTESVNAMMDESWAERSERYTGSRRLLVFVQVAGGAGLILA